MADIFIRHLVTGGYLADNENMKKYPNLERYGIAHDLKLTNKFVSSLIKISAARPFLDEVLASPIEVALLRQAKIRAITYSNQIEGNQLQERAVTALLGAKKVEPQNQDEQEVINYRDALIYAESLATDSRLPSIQDFCDIQKIVTKDTIDPKQSGRLRTIEVSIVNAQTGKVIDKCPDPLLLPDLMKDLWAWIRETEGENPYARAFAFHYMAVAIHPFADGNGRSVRLFQHLLLLRQEEEMARYVPSETVVMRNRDEYYSAIRQSKKLNSLHPFLEFMADCFATASQEVVTEAQKLYEQAKRKRPEHRKQQIIKFAKKNSPFKMADLTNLLPEVPKRTLERDLKELVEAKELKGVGEKRGKKYFHK